ncbi:inactive homolog of metal-dependent proteases [Mesobacillus boroniphilus JCM 21738]|uniref:Inactive homolog of metal-dependent proteases n=1 Tax=Mesobacillus boroniphilus JCM 21738 TaxID=1294265 RepID=W4RWT5_9BACI|nr:inactive homolog of metal-dependent proteases [Mesobacillus boroniphilus JCM 21738]
MKVLSIDTSNYVLGIGLLDGETVLGEYISNIKKNHSVRVMPAIQTLMEECNIKPGDLSKIVVAEGPGSYTGVRIGVTIAKTMAWTLKISLSGVSSLRLRQHLQAAILTDMFLLSLMRGEDRFIQVCISSRINICRL